MNVDYKHLIILNAISHIVFESCTFNKFEQNIEKEEEKKETIINLIRESNKKYIFDMESFKSIIFTNKKIENLSYLLKYLVLEEDQEISSDINNYLVDLQNFYSNAKYIMDRFSRYTKEIKIIFNNIKEKKEFFCLMKFIEIKSQKISFYIKKEIEKENKKEIIKEEKTFELPYQNETKNIIGEYFLRTIDENNKEMYSSVFDYYYTSNEEAIKFNDKEISIKFKEPKSSSDVEVKIRVSYNYKDQWNIIME